MIIIMMIAREVAMEIGTLFAGIHNAIHTVYNRDDENAIAAA